MTADKVVLLVIDGVSDRPCPDLEGQTPLQAAQTPVLDRIAAEGICGIMDPISPGIRPGSDTAHLSILGYPPEDYYTGRGPLEAEGCGIRMEPGMIGFRCNYATMDDAGRISDRRAGRISQTEILSTAIQEGVDLSDYGITISFCSGTGHRAALAFRGEGLGYMISSNDPKKEGLLQKTVQPLEYSAANEKTASALNDFIRQSSGILADHPLNRERAENGLPPANVLLVRGAGQMGHFEPFSTRYGLNGCVIAAATLITGIGRTVGLEHVPVAGITGSTGSSVGNKIQAVIRELDHRDFVLVNIKGTDEAGHDGQATAKRDFLEKVDTEIAPLCDIDDLLLVVCGDHSTPCTLQDHSADPVPIIIRGEGVRVDDVCRYDEYSCTKGGLHRICGGSLMPIVLDLINRAQKYGA